MNKKLMVILAIALAIPLVGFSQVTASKYSVVDKGCPIIIKYIGTSTNNCTIDPAASVILVADGIVNTKLIDNSTIAGIVGWVNAITNESGNRVFSAATWEALSTDTTTNKLIACTNKVVSSAWDKDIFKWDTSVCLTYDVVCDTPNSSGKALGNYELTDIFGDPTGTGNVTLNVYGDDTVLYQKTFTSPYYVITDVGTTNTIANAIVTLESVDFPGIRIGAGQKGLVRATRATTATTGGIGASVGSNR